MWGVDQYILYRPPLPLKHFLCVLCGGLINIFYIDPHPHQNIFCVGGAQHIFIDPHPSSKPFLCVYGVVYFSCITNQSLKSAFSPQLVVLQKKNLIFPGSLLKADHCEKKLKRGDVPFWKMLTKISMCTLKYHVDIEPFYLMLIIIHITCGIALAYCAGKLLDCFHR